MAGKAFMQSTRYKTFSRFNSMNQTWNNPCFAFSGKLLLLKKETDTFHIPTLDEVIKTFGKPSWKQEMAEKNGRYIFMLSYPTDQQNTDVWQWTDLRSSFYLIPQESYLTAGRCSEIIYWNEHSLYCPHCGTRTRQQETIMKKCPSCGYEIYPPIATAIIVLIHKGEEVLLVRAHNFRGDFYGLVAGFLEPGETLEQCVRREVIEETGLEIENIRYFGSQPWPFPCGLMVGFEADYKHGEIKLQQEELADARFFNRHNLPPIPKKMSIARHLIDHWLNQYETDLSD